MTSFNNLKDLEAYLQSSMHQVLQGSAELERVMADTMSQAVIDVVYDAYPDPKRKRRGISGGLADPRNAIVDDVVFDGNTVRLVFRNITEGEDTLYGQEITDTIEDGIKDNWANPNGAWSQPRRFVEETANRLRGNPEEMVNAIKKGLSGMGIKVKN